MQRRGGKQSRGGKPKRKDALEPFGRKMLLIPENKEIQGEQEVGIEPGVSSTGPQAPPFTSSVG